MHQADIDHLVDLAANLAAKDGRHFLVYLLRMALIENRDVKAFAAEKGAAPKCVVAM